MTGLYFNSLDVSNVKSAVFTGMCAIRGRWSDKKEPVIPAGVTMATTAGVFLDARVFFTVLDSVALMMSISRVEHFRPLDNLADVATLLEKNIIYIIECLYKLDNKVKHEFKRDAGEHSMHSGGTQQACHCTQHVALEHSAAL